MSQAAGFVLTKRHVGRHPPAQLVGVLLALNCVVVLPFCLLVDDWHGSTSVLVLHAASVATLLLVSACVFGLMVQGTPTSVALGQALSPLPAVLLASLLLAVPLDPVRAAAGCLVTVAVVASLGGAFGRIPRGRAIALVGIGAVGAAMITTLTKLLTDEGVGLLEIYVVRTGAAAIVALAVFPPRDVPPVALPGLALRAAAVTVFYLLSIAAIAKGDPATVQAAIATSPLMLGVATAIRARQLPSIRLALALVAAPVSIAILASGTT